MRGTYRQHVRITQDVAKARWAAFVRRVLRQARERGMTDSDIAALTGIGDSTFHRWAKNGTLPQLDKLLDFCLGLEVPPEAALSALGVTNEVARLTEPEPDPDILRLGRILNDPAVPEADKVYIRRTVQMLVTISTRKAAERAQT